VYSAQVCPSEVSCRQLVPLQPGAEAEPHIHTPPRQAAEPLGSLPQHRLELLPKHSGGVPVHVAASPEASSAAESGPASHMAHAAPLGRHVHAPFRHWSAGDLMPQQPSQMTGGVPVHAASLVELQPAITRDRRRVEKCRFRICACLSNADAGGFESPPQ
jgi:hypothetical protein